MNGFTRAMIRAGGTTLFLGLIFVCGYMLDRTQFVPLLTCYSLAFGLYVALIKFTGSTPRGLTNLVVIGITARLILLFMMPNLSDDYFRFLWDGNLIIHHINPFDSLPSELIEITAGIPGMTFLLEHMNSPGYYSIYPPVNQSVFAAAAGIGGSNLNTAVIVIRIFMILCEIAAIYSLYRFGYNNAHVWYSLNPLVILEFTGNLHFEGPMIAFLLLSMLALKSKKTITASLFYSLAILTKLHPVLLLPLIWKYLGNREFMRFALVTGLLSITAFLPFLLPVPHAMTRLSHILESVRLYYASFEFNGGIYYLLRYAGSLILGYNPIHIIGKIMAALTLLIIIVLTLKMKEAKHSKLTASVAWFYLAYSLLATVVHPWYVLASLPFALMSGLYTPLAWSALVFLSYSAYGYSTWHENLYLLALEYTFIFAFLLYDVKRFRRTS